MQLLFDLFYKILSMTDTLYDFIFTQIDLSIVGIGNVSLWAILSGSLIVIAFAIFITKKILT